LINDRLDAA